MFCFWNVFSRPRRCRLDTISIWFWSTSVNLQQVLYALVQAVRKYIPIVKTSGFFQHQEKIWPLENQNQTWNEKKWYKIDFKSFWNVWSKMKTINIVLIATPKVSKNRWDLKKIGSQNSFVLNLKTFFFLFSRSKMGLMESWHFCLYKMCWNTSKFRCSYIQSEKCEFRFVDATSSRGNSRFFYINIKYPFSMIHAGHN